MWIVFNIVNWIYQTFFKKEELQPTEPIQVTTQTAQKVQNSGEPGSIQPLGTQKKIQ